MQAVPPGHHDRHREVPDRRADRHRVPIAGQAVIAADDQDRRVGSGRLDQRRAPGLEIKVALAWLPPDERALQRVRGVVAEFGEVVELGRR